MYFLVACGFIGRGLASNGMIGLLLLALGRVWRLIGGVGELWGMGCVSHQRRPGLFSGCCCVGSVATGRGIGISGPGQRRNALER